MALSSKRFLRDLCITLALAALVALGWSQRFAIYDWARLQGYTAPDEIAQLANDTTMTDKSRRLFYANHPELADRSNFNKYCDFGEASIVLGCYVRTKGIYIFKVDDPRLEGVLEVTAAHELLHAAYERLNGGERRRIDGLTSQVLVGITDQRILNTIKSYQARDPNVVPNELHSILATEVRNLPTELEEYYKRYFNNRLALVSFAEHYAQAFEDRRNLVAKYDAQLAEMRDEIDSLQAQIDRRGQELSRERQRMDELTANNQTAEYNASVEPYNQKVAMYNALVRSVQAKIAEFNELVATRNAVALEENELVQAIDSRTNALPVQ